MFAVNHTLKIWKSNRYEKYHDCQVSSSQKNKSTGKYEVTFSGFVRFIGRAHEKRPLPEQIIKILSCGVKTKYVKERRTNYTNFLIYDYELVDGENEHAGTPVFTTEVLPF